MRDLRKKILAESGKTVSRKAQTKQESLRASAGYTPTSSSPNSRVTSRASSRPASRYASEEEDVGSDSELDDVNSTSDDVVLGGGGDDDGDAWIIRLQFRVDELQNRKRNQREREETLAAYGDLLRRHFVPEDSMSDFASDIMAALMKSITAGSSARERLLAIRAVTVTTLTYPSQRVFDHVSHTLKGLCRDAEEDKVKAEAIHALSVTILYGGGLPSDYREMLDFFVDIIETDGAAADAQDSALVVTAALQAWALVATYVDDLAEESEQAMEAFMEQLDSTEVDVQTSAGTNIALLFEAARDYEEETGTSLDLDYNQHKIMTAMSEIVRTSPKTTSRKDRRNLRSSFASIVTSLERGLGPGYSTAGRGGANPHTGGQKEEGDFKEFGYREKVRVHDQLMVIDTWALQARVQALKTHLRGGFGVHFMENPVVEEILEAAQMEQVLGPAALKKAGRDGMEGRRKLTRHSVRGTEGESIA